MNHPTERVIVTEVGMRDGLQSISRIMSTDDKKRWIDAAWKAGIRSMEVASFVPAKLLPQMADAEAVIAHALTASASAICGSSFAGTKDATSMLRMPAFQAANGG